jgi:tape measure domain-containing protein
VAVATVDIQVNSQGAVNSIRNVNNAAQRLESQVQGTTRSVKQLETAFAGLGVAVAGMNALNIAKDFFATANAADAAQRRIKMVSTGLDDYRLVMQTARNASAKFGLSQTEAANAVADIYTRLRPVGFGLSEINAIYEGFNTAVKLSSVEAGAASSAFLQLSQGLGSGTLQGDELRSVLEQMPSITQAIAREMNVTVGSIKKLGSEGKITSEVMIRALDRIRTEGADKLAVAMDTPQQKIVALGNAMEDFKVAVTSDVAPVVIGAIGQITVAIQNATQFVTDLKTGFELLAGAFSGVASGISGINTALSGTIGKFAALGQSKGLMMLLNFMTLGGAGALSQLAGIGAKKNASKPFAAPIGPEMPIRLSMQGLDLGGGGKTGKKGRKRKTDAERAAEKAAEEALRLKNSLGDLAIERDLKQQIYGIDNRIFEANLVNDKQTAIRLEGQKKLAQISAQISKLEYEKLKPQELQSKKQTLLQDAVIAQRDTQQELILNQVQVAKQAEAAIRPIIQEGELLKAKLAGTEQQYQKELLIRQILLNNPTLRRAKVEAIVAENEALAKQLKQAEELNAIYNQIGMSITSGVLDGITAAVEGTKSLGESASQVLKDIAKQLLRSGIMQLLTSLAGNDGVGFFNFLTGSLGKRAMGGPVSAGSSYMVGERGPELFTPKHGGSIVPNNALGGGSTNVVVNVDASGSNVQGDQAQAKQLGVVVSAAVQAELVKQQRPGGLLAGTRR